MIMLQKFVNDEFKKRQYKDRYLFELHYVYEDDDNEYNLDRDIFVNDIVNYLKLDKTEEVYKAVYVMSEYFENTLCEDEAFKEYIATEYGEEDKNDQYYDYDETRY